MCDLGEISLLFLSLSLSTRRGLAMSFTWTNNCGGELETVCSGLYSLYFSLSIPTHRMSSKLYFFPMVERRLILFIPFTCLFMPVTRVEFETASLHCIFLYIVIISIIYMDLAHLLSHVQFLPLLYCVQFFSFSCCFLHARKNTVFNRQ